MNKTMKKALSFCMAAAMVSSVVTVPVGDVSDKADAASFATSAKNATGESIVPYHAHIGFQVDDIWIARDNCTSADRGVTSTKVEGNAYNYLTQFISNNGTKANKFAQGSNTPVDGKFNEPLITDNTTYTLEMNNFNYKDYDSSDDYKNICWNTLFISTNIPTKMEGVNVTDIKVFIDGTEWTDVAIKTASYNTESSTNDGCYNFYIFDKYKTGHGTKYAKNPTSSSGSIISKYQKFPTKSLKIQYTISGVQFAKVGTPAANKYQAVTYTGPVVDQKFDNGNYRYKVLSRSKSDGTAGKVQLVGLSAAGKKKTSLTVPKSKITYASNAKYNVSASIASKAFAKNSKLKTVKLDKGYTTVPSKAFQGDKNLKTVKLGANVKTIGSYAFDGCKKLSSIKLGSKASSIKTAAFRGCTSLKSMNIGKTKSIGKSAFSKCTKLSKLTIANKVKVTKGAFKGCKKTIKLSGKSSYKKATKKNIKKSGYKKVK